MESGLQMRQSLLDLRDAVGWSERLDASLIAGLSVIKEKIAPKLAVIFMLKDDIKTLVRVADQETCDILGPYFETMPADEHVHPPWLNRELTPVCAADHLDDPAWEQMDPKFREWYGTNGTIAPMVGDRRHIGGVLLAFDDPERRLAEDELTYLTLAGRVLGDAVLRIRSNDAIRRETIAGERNRVLTEYESGILDRVDDIAGTLSELSAGNLDADTRGTVDKMQHCVTALQNTVSAQVEKPEPPTQLALGSFSQVLPKDLEIYAQKWDIRVSYDAKGSQRLDRLPLFTQSTLREIVQIVLSDIRERVSATEVSVMIDATDSQVTLSIIDNGVANTYQLQAASQRVLRERVEDLGGRVMVRSLAPLGTQVELTILNSAHEQTSASSSVLLADPDALFREGLAALLRQWDEFRVVGRVTDSRSVLSEVQRLLPDLLVIDVTTAGGLPAIRRLRLQCPGTKIVVLTTTADEKTIGDSLEAGVCGYLLKDSSPEQLRDDLNCAVAGNVAISPAIATSSAHAAEKAHVSRMQTGASLTNHEIEVLTLITNGFSNEEIAQSLHISISSVKKRIKQMMTKLHLDNRVQLAVYAIRTGIAY